MRDVLCDDVICDAHRDTHLSGIVLHSVIHYHAFAALTGPQTCCSLFALTFVYFVVEFQIIVLVFVKWCQLVQVVIV